MDNVKRIKTVAGGAGPMYGSICFFNNKGGVGKTTLACNIASYLAEHERLNVLVIDADPQCNATQLILDDTITGPLFMGAKASTKIDSLKDVLQPLFAGDASLSTDFAVADPSTNRVGVSILPGHPQVALLEDILSQNWTQFLGAQLGGARVSNWNTQLLSHMSNKYDLIVYDVGPSLGALNRSILIGADYFLAPMGCDIFSLIGIGNIATWIRKWQKNYDESYARCKEDHRDELDRYKVRDNSSHMSRFIGYTVQQYITKTIRQERRATGAYDDILNRIPSQIDTSLAPLFAPPLKLQDVRLGDVPHMFSLVPLAQTKRAPIHGLTSKDGISGGQYGQQRDYNKFIGELASSLMSNLKKVSEKSHD